MPKVVHLGLARSHTSLVGNGKKPVQIVIMLLFYEHLEIVACTNGVGVEKDANGIVDFGPSSKNL